MNNIKLKHCTGRLKYGKAFNGRTFPSFNFVVVVLEG
jgi:hypothetical protein